MLLALLAGLAAVIAAYHTLQCLHILPFWLGPMSFFAFDLLGALLWGVTAACFVWAKYCEERIEIATMGRRTPRP
jgi:hypothetical protein